MLMSPGILYLDYHRPTSFLIGCCQVSPKYRCLGPTADEPGILHLLRFRFELTHQMNLMLYQTALSELDPQPVEVILYNTVTASTRYYTFVKTYRIVERMNPNVNYGP